jgi:hypothetical protein
VVGLSKIGNRAKLCNGKHLKSDGNQITEIEPAETKGEDILANAVRNNRMTFENSMNITIQSDS